MKLKDSISTRRIRAIVLREFNEVIRDPLYMSLALLVPPFIMVMFGFGLSLDVDHVPLGISDQDDSKLSRSYVDAFIQSESFDDAGRYTDLRTLDEDLRVSRIRAALVINEGFEQEIREGRQPEVSVWIDGTLPIRGAVARSYAKAIHNRFLAQMLAHQNAPQPNAGPRIETIARVRFNQELRSTNLVVPGLIATTLMFYPALLTTLSIVREKESQSILALYCSPITKTELLLGKLLPYLAISLVNFVSMFLLALFLFAVPFRGSLPLLAVASAIYVFATCGVGMLISVLVSTQVAAILITMVVTLLPSFLYSGFFTPLTASTWSVWVIGRFIPATYYLDILRGVFLKGTGWELHWPALLVLALFSLIFYGISFKSFRKRLA